MKPELFFGVYYEDMDVKFVAYAETPEQVMEYLRDSSGEDLLQPEQVDWYNAKRIKLESRPIRFQDE